MCPDTKGEKRMVRLVVFALTLLSILCAVYGKGSPITRDKENKNAGAFCGPAEISTARAASSRANYITPGYFNNPRPRYRNNLNCSTTLKLHNSQRTKNLRIKFLQIQLQGGTGCNNDYIIIFDNLSGKLMAKLCGSTPRNTVITVPSKEARLVFVTDSSVTARGAKLKFWSVNRNWRSGVLCGGDSFSRGHCLHCGGRLVSRSGSIESLLYGTAEYPNNMFCEWNIEVEEANQGERLMITFENLNLESQEQCHYDHLVIYDPTISSPLVTLCGSTCSPVVVMSSHSARITFTTDLSVTYDGFVLNFEMVPADMSPGTLCMCGPYEGCFGPSVITTTTSPPTTPLLPIWPGTELPPRPPPANTCSGNYTAVTGTLRSPNYPEDYPNNARCINNITVPERMHIRLTLSNFHLEFHDNCAWDSFSVYLDGSSLAYSTLCGTHSGTRDLPSNRVTLVFESDGSITYAGYDIMYTAIHPEDDHPDDENALCGGTLTSPSGEIMSPNYPYDYPNDVECHWQITLPRNKAIQLHVMNFELESHSSCNFDKLTIWDGYSCAHFCGNYFNITQLGDVYASHSDWDNGIFTLGNELSLVFTSDTSVVYPGFHFRYQSVDADSGSDGDGDGGDSSGSGDGGSTGDCGGYLTSSEGEIFSPNYPDNYPDGIQCQWVIEVDEGMVIRIHAEEWRVEEHPSCAYDRLTIVDGSSEFDYCNYFRDYTSSWHAVTLVFQTDSSVTHSGFHLTYEAMDPADVDDGGTGNAGNPGDGTCGPVYSAVAAPLIVGGNDAEVNEYPWMVMLRSYGSFVCGGTIISDRWIVTAAHCVEEGSQGLSVMIGGHHLYDDEYVISVSRVYMHHEYNTYTNEHDIAMLELSSLIEWSSTTAPACLSRQDPPIGLECIITGWGDTEAETEYNLQEATVPILADEECARGYGSALLGDMMCAGYMDGGIDTCQGDSGGPVVCLIGGVWELHGVTSWGYGCADRLFPGIYTRVARYIDWMIGIAS